MSGEQWGKAVDAAALAMYGTPRLAERNREMAERAVRAAAELIVADTRRKVAEEIEATFAANARSELDRPKVERGGFLGDREWAAAIARGSGNGDSGQEGT